MIISVYYFIIYLAESLIWAEYVSNIFKSKRSGQLKFLILFLIYLGLFFVSTLNLVWLNITTFLFGNFIFILLFYYAKWYIAFFHAATATAIMSLCELATYHFFPQHPHNEQTVFMLIIWALLSKTIYFTVLFFLSRIFKEKESNYDQYDKTSFLLVGIPIMSIIIMLILFSTSKNSDLDKTHQWLISIGSTLLLCMNLLIFFIYSHNQRKNIAFVQMQLFMQKEHDSSAYYEMLLKQSESQRILIHDIKKHIQSISLLNEQKNYEKMDAYIQCLFQSPALQNAIRVCDNELLNMILNRYQKQCLEKGITLHPDIRSAAADFIEDNDLTSLFCNLLDNAVEAAEKVPGGYIELSVGNRSPSSYTVITMTNSCPLSPFSKNGSQLISHKKNRIFHGYGMKSIEKIVEKYHGNLQTYYDSKNASFHTIIALKERNHSNGNRT